MQMSQMWTVLTFDDSSATQRANDAISRFEDGPIKEAMLLATSSRLALDEGPNSSNQLKGQLEKCDWNA